METKKITTLLNGSAKEEILNLLFKEAIKNEEYSNIANLFGIEEEDHSEFVKFINMIKK